MVVTGLMQVLFGRLERLYHGHDGHDVSSINGRQGGCPASGWAPSGAIRPSVGVEGSSFNLVIRLDQQAGLGLTLVVVGGQGTRFDLRFDPHDAFSWVNQLLKGSASPRPEGRIALGKRRPQAVPQASALHRADAPALSTGRVRRSDMLESKPCRIDAWRRARRTAWRGRASRGLHAEHNTSATPWSLNKVPTFLLMEVYRWSESSASKREGRSCSGAWGRFDWIRTMPAYGRARRSMIPCYTIKG